MSLLHANGLIQHQHLGRGAGGARRGRGVGVLPLPAPKKRGLEFYGVLGGIGVGKSTLLRRVQEETQGEAAPEIFVTYPELVNEQHLGVYINQPILFAKEFQMTMMHGACTRTTDGYALLKTTHIFREFMPSLSGVLVERIAQENVRFAISNHQMGWMSDQQLEEYRRSMGSYARSVDHKPPGHGEHIHFLELWAPELTTLQRMIERKRFAEDAYTDRYLCRLFNSAFLTDIEVAIRLRQFSIQEGLVGTGPGFARLLDATKSPWKDLQLPLIVNWTQYGTWKGLRAQVQRRRPPSEIAVWKNKKVISFEVPNRPLDPGATSPRIDLAPGVLSAATETSPDIPTYLDLGWYLATITSEHPMDYQRLLANFRDHYFEARSRDQEVHLLVSNSKDLERFLGMLHYYDGPAKEHADAEEAEKPAQPSTISLEEALHMPDKKPVRLEQKDV
jgi:hypothetical protein